MNPSQLRKWLRYNAVFKPLAKLPFSVSYAATNLIGTYDFRQQNDTREFLGERIKRVFPQVQQDQELLESWLQAHFKMMAREMMDVFCMPRLKASHNPLVSLSEDALDVLADAKRDGRRNRGVILAMSHYNRLIMPLVALSLANQTLGMLTMIVDERNPYLDPIERSYINTKVNRLHSFIGGRWLTLGDNLRGLYQGLRNGETIVMLFDAFVPEQQQHKKNFPFLGGQLAVPRGVERLAEQTGARMVYCSAEENDWRITGHIKALPESPQEALRQAVAYLEQDVRQAPWQWWYWSVLDHIWSPAENKT